MVEQRGMFDTLAGNAGGLTVSKLVGLIGACDTQVRRRPSAFVAARAVTTLKDDPAGPARPTLRSRLSPTTSGWPKLVRMPIAAAGLGQGTETSRLPASAVPRWHAASSPRGR